MITLNHRLAARADIPALKTLVNAAIGELLKPFLSADEIAASFHVMGLDTKLIEDGTYFAIESGASRRLEPARHAIWWRSLGWSRCGIARSSQGRGAGSGHVHTPIFHAPRGGKTYPEALRGRRGA